MPWEVTPERREHLVSIRARGLKLVLPFLPFIVLALIVIGQTWAYIVFAVWGALWLGSLASISVRIRRSR